MNITEDECAECGSTLEEVRPGKWQCTKCELDQMMVDQYNNGYQAGLTQSQTDSDESFWLKQYAGMVVQGIVIGKRTMPVLEGDIAAEQAIQAYYAVQQAKALMEELKRHEDGK